MSATLVDAVISCMARDQQYVPVTHPTTRKAVLEAERALAHGVPMTIAVAFGVARANNRAAHTLAQIGA